MSLRPQRMNLGEDEMCGNVRELRCVFVGGIDWKVLDPEGWEGLEKLLWA